MLSERLTAAISRDEKIKALADALDAELVKIASEVKLPLHLPRLDELNHQVLDALADMYNVIFYQPESMTAATKRKLIRQAILDHRVNGTKYAVENMLNRLTRGAEISEWYEYGGEPYYFKLKLKGLQDYDDDGELFMRIVESTKNLRSWLDAVDFDLTREHPDEILYYGLIQLYLGKIGLELESAFKDRERLRVWLVELLHGGSYYELEPENICDVLKISAGIVTLEHGRVKYSAEIEEAATWYEIWLNYIKMKWREWQAARVIWGDEKPEPIDDEPFDEEVLFDMNFIKLRMDFHNSDETRLTVIPNPREDLTAAEILAVPVDGIFLSRRGYLSNKIVWASLVNKRHIKIL